MTSPYTFIALEFFALVAVCAVLAATITRVTRLAKRIEDQDARLRRADWGPLYEPGAKTLPVGRFAFGTPLRKGSKKETGGGE